MGVVGLIGLVVLAFFALNELFKWDVRRNNDINRRSRDDD